MRGIPFCSALTLMVASIIGSGAAGAAPNLRAGQPIDPTYVAKFATCDMQDTFGGVHFPIRAPNGKVLWYGCKTDPSRFVRFDRVAAAANQPEAVVIVSKLGHDQDGSFAACHHAGGPTDQCTTSLMLKATPRHPCQVHGTSAFCVPVDPDEVAYIVVPASAPRTTPAIEAGAFGRLSGLTIGDYGVVIVGARVVPVIIADSGPAYKMGEGSTALLRSLSADGKVRPFSSGVTFVLFPRTHRPVAKIDVDTLPADVKARALGCFRVITTSASPTSTCEQSPRAR